MMAISSSAEDGLSSRWIEYAAARFVLTTLSAGSSSFAFRLASFYVKLLDLAIPRLRQTADRNLRMALPHLSEEERARIADGSFHSIARILVAVARFPTLTKANIGDWIAYEGYEHYETAKARGKGVLFATAHLGNWELSAVAHSLMSEPMHVVVRAFDNPLIDKLVHKLRASTGNRVVEKRDYVRGILRALAANEAVGILIDQNTGLDEGVFIDFFGVKACVARGFARIAARSQAAVIAGFALWRQQEKQYVLKFCEPVYATGDVLEDTQRIHAKLEEVIRQHPEQWLWMHRRWKTRPSGEPPLY